MKKIARALTLEGILSRKQWHSSIGFGVVESSNQKQKKYMANNEENIVLFDSGGYFSKVKIASSIGIPGELLIKKSDRALWKVSDDGKRIEPAFSDDIITIDEED